MLQFMVRTAMCIHTIIVCVILLYLTYHRLYLDKLKGIFVPRIWSVFKVERAGLFSRCCYTSNLSAWLFEFCIYSLITNLSLTLATWGWTGAYSFFVILFCSVMLKLSVALLWVTTKVCFLLCLSIFNSFN